MKKRFRIVRRHLRQTIGRLLFRLARRLLSRPLRDVDQAERWRSEVYVQAQVIAMLSNEILAEHLANDFKYLLLKHARQLIKAVEGSESTDRAATILAFAWNA